MQLWQFERKKQQETIAKKKEELNRNDVEHVVSFKSDTEMRKEQLEGENQKPFLKAWSTHIVSLKFNTEILVCVIVQNTSAKRWHERSCTEA